jgi:FkbM family methyltransferase
MLITFEQLVKRHRLHITGFIQVGAHFAEELKDFREHIIGSTSNIHLFEPLPEAFAVVKNKANEEKVYNIALGSKEGMAEMFVDKENTGQSSSILEPALHLKQYPDITFPTKIRVKVRTLDSYNIQGCNALWMDVQGYEIEVLKGAVKTLENIDYVYTEVNVDEVYKGCARLYDMDEFLLKFGFERVELDLSGKTWGDAFYIKKKLIGSNLSIKVPTEFQKKINVTYPPDNFYIFEEWFSDCVSDNVFDNFSGYTYIPVWWTGYYCNNDYGRNQAALKRLQNYLDSLDNKQPYFTIAQYDDGILNDLRDKDVTVFNLGGGSIKGQNIKIITLPLLGQEHKFNFDGIQRNVMCNFVGRIGTHPVRKKMQDFVFGKQDYYVHFNLTIDKYCETLARSFFTLAPRGYGRTSFRIWESLQYGSVPIYITEDEPILPDFYDHEHKPCMLICKPHEIHEKMMRLFSNRALYNEYVANGQFYFDQYYNYNGLSQYILDTLYLTAINK